MSFSESEHNSRSFWHLFIFVWILFLLFQQGQRLFLFSEALTIEMPLRETLITTSITGFRADVIISTLAAGLLQAWLGYTFPFAMDGRTQESLCETPTDLLMYFEQQVG